MRKTKIICTVGPSVDSDESIRELIKAGANCFRLNFSHGDHQEHLQRIIRIKKIREELSVSTPILMDTKGPEIRIGNFKNGFVEIKRGQTFNFYNDIAILGDNNGVAITHNFLYKLVQKGLTLFLDDGNLPFEIVNINGTVIETIARVDGKLSNKKSINIPDFDTKLDYLSDQDKKDIKFALEHGVDFIAASFARDKQDIKNLKSYIKELKGKVKLISKIENFQGIENIDKIIDISDGIMVARGDLGIEIPFEEIPKYQKMIINKCIDAGKLVITATQMLESMVHNPRPTRAEVSDVANAVFDGSHVVMLSGETAAGKYPITAVKTMSDIINNAELSPKYGIVHDRKEMNFKMDVLESTCLAACYAAEALNSKLIITVTRSGRTAKMLSNFRPSSTILALSYVEETTRELNLIYNVLSATKKLYHTLEDLTNSSIAKAKELSIVNEGDFVVLVLGSGLEYGAPSDTMRIIKI